MRRMMSMVLLLAAILVSADLFAQRQAATPAWLLYEKGRAAAEARDYGRALQSFKDAIAAAGIFPEAEMSIGDVYREEGEFSLSERQYIKAYNLKNALAIPYTKYDILYRLASLYEDQELYQKMRTQLETVLRDDSAWSGSQSALLRIQVEKNYTEKGLDQVLKLYRFDDFFAIPAHQKLAWLDYRTGLTTASIPHFLYAIIEQVTEIDSFLKRRDATYAFSTLASFLAVAIAHADSLAYVQENGILADLYLLASATHQGGRPKLASATWKMIAGIPEAGRFAELSRRQLAAPFYEPLLQPSYEYFRKP